MKKQIIFASMFVISMIATIFTLFSSSAGFGTETVTLWEYYTNSLVRDLLPLAPDYIIRGLEIRRILFWPCLVGDICSAYLFYLERFKSTIQESSMKNKKRYLCVIWVIMAIFAVVYLVIFISIKPAQTEGFNANVPAQEDFDVMSYFSNDTETEDDVERRNAEILEVVEIAYSGEIDDKEILTSNFYNQIYSSGDFDAWANLGYWKYSDGRLHSSYQINGIKEDDYGNIFVKVYIEDMKTNDQVFGDIHNIELLMTFYEGNWYISGIDGYTEDGQLVYSSLDFID